MNIWRLVSKDPNKEPNAFAKIVLIFGIFLLIVGVIFDPILSMFGNQTTGVVDRFWFKTAFIKYTYKGKECECKVDAMYVDSVGEIISIRFFPFATDRCLEEFKGIKPVDKIRLKKRY